MDDASPVAVNWLRAAVEAIQDRAQNKGQKSPADKLEAFVNDTRHAGHSRRLAYECLVRIDPTTPIRLLPKMLNDPSSELRRDAVAVKLEQAAKTDFATPAAKIEFFKDLLQHARDRDQVDGICAELKKQKVDIDQTPTMASSPAGCSSAPSTTPRASASTTSIRPKKGVDPKASYPGKSGAGALAGTYHHEGAGPGRSQRRGRQA